jgi:hypothetical protein
LPKSARFLSPALAALAILAGTAAFGQEVKPDNTPATIIAATKTCIDVFLEHPDPAGFVSIEKWEYAERTPNSRGIMPRYHRVVHRFEKVALHYVPGEGCVVFAGLLDQEFDGERDNGRTREVLVNGMRAAIEGEHGFIGFRTDASDLFHVVTLATERFDIEIELAPPPPGGSYYIIEVKAPEAASDS